MKSENKIASPMFRFRLEQYGPDGVLKWRKDFHNTVVTVGKNEVVDLAFRGGTGPTWYLGLKGTGNVALADTMQSHAGWAEETAYSGTSRITLALAAGVGGTSTNAPGTYAMTGTYTVAGAFVSDNVSAGGTTGVLYSASDFASVRTGGTGDTLVVTPTLVVA